MGWQESPLWSGLVGGGVCDGMGWDGVDDGTYMRTRFEASLIQEDTSAPRRKM